MSDAFSEPEAVSSQISDGVAPTRRRVLIVDDDQGLIRLVRTILRMANYDVDTASDGNEALELATKEHPDVIVLDLRMPRLDGPGFFRELRSRGDRTPVLVASAYGARHAQRELGAEGSIEKPFDPDALVAAVGGLMPRQTPTG